MKTLVSLVKNTKYVLWVIAAVVVGVLFFLARTLFAMPRSVGTGRLPEVPEKLRTKVEKVQEDALVARVEARVEATKAKEELDRVAEIEDGAERRKRLAEIIRAPK